MEYLYNYLQPNMLSSILKVFCVHLSLRINIFTLDSKSLLQHLDQFLLSISSLSWGVTFPLLETLTPEGARVADLKIHVCLWYLLPFPFPVLASVL